LQRLRSSDVTERGRRLAVLPSGLLAAGAILRDLQPLAGRFEVEQDAVVFVPRFPFMDGMRYSLLVEQEEHRGRVEVGSIERPQQRQAPATTVIGIYPSAATVPVNLLKLYIYFSAPMSTGFAARAVQVRRWPNGEPLESVFLPTDETAIELWDRERRRLTLLLDPGRIKRGLVSNREAGYPLVEGESILVVVQTSFPDATGNPLRAGAERRYDVGPPLRTRIEPARWQLAAPAAGTLTPLIVTFDRPLDQALLQHCLTVCDPSGASCGGSASAGLEERCWQFVPATPWLPGDYLLAIDPRLEDLAGNSLLRVFDREIAPFDDAPAHEQPAALAFTCAAETSRTQF
jgi:hypothetical protein